TDTLADTSPDQLQVFSKKERANKLHEAVQELPPKMRQCLQLHIAEASNKEIASVMGITEDTVKAHINQSKEKLKEKLSRYFESMDF
ncbi:MAG: RNA polymerase sigma factor, partial [Acidobacteriota bacterium]